MSHIGVGRGSYPYGTRVLLRVNIYMMWWWPHFFLVCISVYYGGQCVDMLGMVGYS